RIVESTNQMTGSGSIWLCASRQKCLRQSACSAAAGSVLGRRAVSGLFHLIYGDEQKLGHFLSDFGIRIRQAGGVEIAAQLAQDVMVAAFFKDGADHATRIGVAFVAVLAEFFGSPQADKLVSTRYR